MISVWFVFGFGFVLDRIGSDRIPVIMYTEGTSPVIQHIYLRWTYLDSTTAYVQTISRKNNNKNNNDFYNINFAFFMLSFNRILYIYRRHAVKKYLRKQNIEDHKKHTVD